MSRISYIEDMKEWEQSFKFHCSMKVRFCETDAFGHLNNTKVFIYLEEARIEFFKHLQLMQSWASPDFSEMIVAADLQCNYLKQIYFDEKLKTYVKVAHIGNSSLDLHYMIKNEKDEICITARGVIVQASKATGKAVPLSDEIKQKLQKYM